MTPATASVKYQLVFLFYFFLLCTRQVCAAEGANTLIKAAFKQSRGNSANKQQRRDSQTSLSPIHL